MTDEHEHEAHKVESPAEKGKNVVTAEKGPGVVQGVSDSSKIYTHIQTPNLQT